MKIAATGLSGLVGSRVVELLKDKHQFIKIGLSAGIDFLDKKSVSGAIKKADPDVILNFAAKADVDGCENDKELGKKGDAWKLNVIGAENMALVAKEHSKRLIHISTDFVFNGEKDFYQEVDITSAVDWYGATKLEGEKAIRRINPDFILARIAYPYRASFEKKDFVRAMLTRLRKDLPIKGVIDHLMTPTFIDDIARALDLLFQKGEKGVYHVTGSEAISPYEAALLMCEKFDLDKSLVSKTTRAEYFKGKARRPFRLYLKNDKIQKLGARMQTFEQGLEEIKVQMSQL